MSRRVGLLLLVIVLLVGGAVAVVVTANGPLQDRRDAVDARWAPIRTPLTDRYDRLNQVATALNDAGAGERTYTVDLVQELDTWRKLADSPTADAGAEAASANQLEGLAARARANVAFSGRLKANPAITSAFDAFDSVLVPPPTVSAYNRAVKRYEATRTESMKQLAASLLGFDARPTLVIGASSG